ncbi:MAG: retron St85 family effector protein [Caulobacteraceae bacterium]
MIAEKSNVPDLVEWIDLGRLHVHAPTTVVLLCGGKIELTAPKPVSLRDAFERVRHSPPLALIEFRRAEEIDLYRPRQIYTNWVDFESHLAQLCQLVLLFCESEGSIAELGTFVAIDEIARKLFVVVDKEIYDRADSYVILGPVQLLSERYHTTYIYVLDLNGLNIKSIEDVRDIDLVEFRDRIAEELPPAVASHREPRTFDAGERGM